MLFDSFEAYDVQETRRVSREEGRVEGHIQGKIEAVLELLEDIGEIPSLLRERIQAETDLEILKNWLTLAAKSETIQEFQMKANL